MNNLQETVPRETYKEGENTLVESGDTIKDILDYTIGKNPRVIGQCRIENPHSADLKDGVYCLECPEQLQAIIEFDLTSPGKKITAGNSSHKIQSGEITTGGTGEKRHLLVAIKASSSTRRCFIQIKNMQRIEQAGFSIFKILYIIVRNKKPYLVTQSEMDIIPIDTYNFQGTEREETLFYGIGNILSRMHARRITHGDAQMKNFVLDNGRIRVIDFEKTTFHELPNDNFYKDVNNDFQAIVQSILISKNLSPRYRRVYIEILLQGYIDHLTNLYVKEENTTLQEEILDLINKIETNYQQFYRYQKMPQLHQQSGQEGA